LAQRDDISSTEKLLNLIRGDNAKQSEASPGLSSPLSVSSSAKKIIPFRKAVTIGVDIGANELLLAKIVSLSEQKRRLVDYRREPFNPGISKNSPEFLKFLKSALIDFCGSAKSLHIWCITSSVNVETRYMKIPKVARNKIANVAYWTYKKEIAFNEEQDLFDFELLGEIAEDGFKKMAVMAYTAPKREVNELKDLFIKIGFPLTGMTIVPFAIQNLLRSKWIETGAKDVCCLYIGENWSRIDVFSQGNLTVSRGIKAGKTSLIEAIREGMAENAEMVGHLSKTEASLGIEEEGQAVEFDQAREMLYRLLDAPPISPEDRAEPGPMDAGEEKIFRMLNPALERMVRQVERTLEYYRLTFKDADVGKIYISGEVCSCPRLVQHIGVQLNLPTESLDPFAVEVGSAIELPGPKSAMDRSAFVPSVGLALSSAAITPNFISTYEDKEKATSVRRINRVIFAAFIFFLALNLGAYFWQGHRVRVKKVELAELEQKLGRYVPTLDQGLILQMVALSGKKKQDLKDRSQRYLGLAVISELSKITPLDIRLLNITINIDRAMADPNRVPAKTLLLEGVVLGDPLTLETTLTGYMLKLKSSLLFSQSSVEKQSLETVGGDKVLRFAAQINVN